MPALSTLGPGQTGTIERVEGTGAVMQRLLEMGLTEGELVEVVRLAPLGDPVEIRVRGYELSLRKREADFVTVRIC